MANLIKHRFASAKADGPDPTQIQPSHWNDGHLFSGGNAGDLLTRDPTDATYGAKWAPPTTWVDVPYAAANFTAPGGTWTVDAGDILTYGYYLIGKIVNVTVFIDSSSVGSGVGGYLMANLPGFPSTKYIDGVARVVDNGTLGFGYIRIFPGESLIRFQTSNPSGIWTASVNNTSVHAQMSYPIA